MGVLLRYVWIPGKNFMSKLDVKTLSTTSKNFQMKLFRKSKARAKDTGLIKMIWMRKTRLTD
jgi:hypothetical protein